MRFCGKFLTTVKTPNNKKISKSKDLRQLGVARVIA